MPGVGTDFTPQEIECIRIALDAYEAESDEHADSLEAEGADDHDLVAIKAYRNEAAVARSARTKLRGR